MGIRQSGGGRGEVILTPGGGSDDWARVAAAWAAAAYKYPVVLGPGAWTIAAGSFQRMYSGTTLRILAGAVITSHMTDTTDPDGATGHWGPFYASTPSTSLTHATTTSATVVSGTTALPLTSTSGYTVGATVYVDFAVNAAIYTVKAISAAWHATTLYAVGNVVTNSNNAYVCLVAGTSAGSGGPTTTAGSITDGGATWAYIGAGQTACVQVDRPILKAFPSGTAVSVSPPSVWYPTGRPQDISILAEPGAILQGTWARAIEIIGGKNCLSENLRILDQGNGLGGAVTILCSYDWGGQDNIWRRMLPESTSATPAGDLLAVEDNEGSGFDACATLGGQNGYNIVGSDLIWSRNCTARLPTASGYKIENDSGATIGNTTITLANPKVDGAGVSPSTAAAINVLGNATDIRITDPDIGYCYSGIAFGSSVSDTEIIGGTIQSCTHEAILFPGTTGHRVVGLKTRGNYTSSATGHGIFSLAANAVVTFSALETDETGYPFNVSNAGVDLTIAGWHAGSTVNGTVISVNLSGASTVKISDATFAYSGTGTKLIAATGAGCVLNLFRCKLLSGGTYGVDAEAGTLYVRDCDFSSAVTAAYIAGGAWSWGTVTLNGATGVDITFPDARTNSRLSLTRKTAGGTPGNAPTWTVTAGSKFTVTGTAGDTSVYEYEITGA